MDGGIAEVKEYALSDDDLRACLGSNIKILTYPDLARYRNIDDIFDDKGRCILLFPNAAPTVGHWTCLIRRDSCIEFFDSYGDPPEKQKKGVPMAMLQEWGMAYPHLIRLLRQADMPVYYNTHQFQSGSPDVATCGRWCAVRLLYQPYSLDKFASIIEHSGLSPDNFVAGVIADKLGK
jgi:hypothetical protein